MRKKRIFGFILLLLLLLPFKVEAKEFKLMLSYFANDGEVASGNVEVISGVVFIKNDIKSDVTYTSSQTINHINSLDGTSTFQLKKGNNQQTKTKEWYAINYSTGKKIYFSNAKSYTVKEIVKKLNIDTSYYERTGSPLEIYLQANYGKVVPVDKIGLSTSSIKIKRGKTITLKATVKPNNATDDEVTWSSSDTTKATVNAVGKVKGISPGKVKITAKSSNGKTADCTVTVFDAYTVNINFNANGGKLVEPYSSAITISNGLLYKKGKKYTFSIPYNSSTTSTGLPNYNGLNSINIALSGSYVESGKEWNTKADGSGKSYSQSEIYKDSAFCDASHGDCEITLYVNWKKEEESKPFELAKKAVKETMQAWYMRGDYRQYNGSKSFHGKRFPEDSTSQDKGYSVCTAFTYDVLYGAFGMDVDQRPAEKSNKYNNLYVPRGSNEYSVQARNYIDTNGCKSTNDKCHGERVIFYSSNVKNDHTTYYYKNAQNYSDFMKNLQVGDVIAYTNLNNNSGHVLMVYDFIKDSKGNPTNVVLLNSTLGKYARYKRDNDRDLRKINYSIFVKSRFSGTRELYYFSAVPNDNRLLDFSSSGVGMKNEGTIRYSLLSQRDQIVAYDKNNKPSKIICGSNYKYCSVTRFFYKDGKDVEYNIKTSSDGINRGILRTRLSGIYINKTADSIDNNSVYPNQTITYTVSVTNNSSMTKTNVTYPAFYLSETIPDNAVFISSEKATFSNGKVIWRVNNLKPKETRKFTYKVKVKNQVGGIVEETGKAYIDSESFIPTGTIRNSIIKTPAKKTKSYSDCYKKYENSGKKGKNLIDAIYKCAYNYNAKYDINLDEFTFDNVIVLESNNSSKRKLANNNYGRMVLNNYWNYVTYSKNKDTGEYSCTLPSWGSYEITTTRAQTIDSSHFKDGDVLLYEVNNSLMSAKEFTKENGLYAYIYLDGIFVGKNGSGSTERNKYTPDYYNKDNKKFEKPFGSLYKNIVGAPEEYNISKNDLNYFNYQALFSKDRYVILRPEQVI